MARGGGRALTQRLHPRSFRLLKLSAPHDEFIAFGLAAAVWRGLCFALASLLVLWREAPSLPAAAAAFHALGVRSTLGGTLLLAGSGLAFPVAVALTTATNVLVILAMTPFACALMSRATGVRLPLHAWIAAVCGVAFDPTFGGEDFAAAKPKPAAAPAAQRSTEVK